MLNVLKFVVVEYRELSFLSLSPARFTTSVNVSSAINVFTKPDET